MLVLNAPHSPRSAVATISKYTSSLPVPESRRGAPAWPRTPSATLAITAFIFSAYGRAASAASCARRSFDAATICCALVILRIDVTVAIRRRKEIRLGILGKALGEIVQQRLQLVLGILG